MKAPVIQTYKGAFQSTLKRVIIGSGLKQNWPEILNDGNTVAWFDFTDESTITLKPEHSLITDVVDKIGKSIKLSQAEDTSKMPYNGNAVSSSATKYTNNTILLTQPFVIYISFKIDEIYTNSTLFAANDAVNRSAVFRRDATSVTNYTMTAGINTNTSVEIILGEYCVMKVVFDGANSILKLNDIVSNLLSPGTNGLNGFAINTFPGVASGMNGAYREIIIRRIVDSESNDVIIYNYIKSNMEFSKKLRKSSYTFTPYEEIEIPIVANENMNNLTNAYGINLMTAINPTDVYDLYDSICPESKVQIGTSVLLNPIYSYTFARRTGKIKIAIICTVHGGEHAPFFGIYKLFKYMYLDNLSDSKYTDFKDKFDVTIIPVANPDGMINYTRNNNNGIDINRNFPIHWKGADGGIGSATYGGTAPLSEPETNAIANICGNYDIVIDIHSNGGNTIESPTLFWISTTSPFMKAVFEAQYNQLLSYLVANYTSMEGVTNIGYVDSLAAGTVQCYANSKKETLSMTLEIATANPYIGTTQYLAEILDMNEYILFNAIYKTGLEFIANI